MAYAGFQVLWDGCLPVLIWASKNQPMIVKGCRRPGSLRQVGVPLLRNNYIINVPHEAI